MLHFSCDLCGKPLNDERFVVKLEVYPAFDPDDIDEDVLDADHLAEISELIEEMELTGEIPEDTCQPKQYRFDLCHNCQMKYVKDPLGRDAARRLNFSEN